MIIDKHYFPNNFPMTNYHCVIPVELDPPNVGGVSGYKGSDISHLINYVIDIPPHLVQNTLSRLLFNCEEILSLNIFSEKMKT